MSKDLSEQSAPFRRLVENGPTTPKEDIWIVKEALEVTIFLSLQQVTQLETES